MKLESIKKADVVSEGLETNKMQIDTNSISILQHILSEGLYEDPITALCAELSNNAVDSVIESGKNPIENPVIVKIHEENDNYFFSVKDEGLGVNEEEFNNIIGCYLKSTKRENAEAYGFFGLGRLSPLSYNDSFYWICRKEGIERKFIIFKGEEFTEYTKVYEKECSESNGVEVIVPIKNNYDKEVFIRKAKQKLSYYDTVVMIFDGEIVKDYKIYREEDFQFSTLYQGNSMHLCLKDVLYEIDWSKLGRNKIGLPIALRFGLQDSLQPTPSREGLIYNKSTIDVINAKIDKVCKWFVDKYNSEVGEVESFISIYDSLNPYNSKFLEVAGKNFNVSILTSKYDPKNKLSLDNPGIKGISKINLTNLYHNKYCLTYDYKVMGAILGDKYTKNVTEDLARYKLNKATVWTGTSYKSTDYNFILIDDERPRGVLMDYIKHKYANTAVFVKKLDIKIPLKTKEKDNFGNPKDSLYKWLLLHKYDKNEWRQVIDEFNTIRKEFTTGFIDVNSIVIDDKWLEERKANRKIAKVTKVTKEEINPKFAETMEKYNSEWNCKFVAGNKKKIDEYTTDITYIYSTYEDRKRLDNLYSLFRNKKGISICVLVERDIERINNAKLDNWITVDEFMKGGLEIFGNYCTARKIELLETEQGTLFDNTEFISKLDSELAKNMVILTDWYTEISKGNTLQVELMEQMLTICEEKDLWNKEMYEIYKDVREKLVDLEFLNFLKRKRDYGYSESRTIDDSSIEFAKQYYNNLKTNKIEIEHEQA